MQGWGSGKPELQSRYFKVGALNFSIQALYPGQGKCEYAEKTSLLYLLGGLERGLAELVRRKEH